MRALPLLAVLALAACQTDRGTVAPPGPGTTDQIWELASIDGAALPWPVTLGFGDGGRVFGQAPCNLYFGTVARDGASLAFDAIGMTEMACLDPARMQADASFAARLAAMDRAEQEGSVLTLTGAGHVMVFRLP